MKTKYKYIEMEIIPKNKKRKTNIFTVKNIKLNYIIGKIEWFSSWRQYCFFPGYNTIYSKGCLDDISHFINQLMEERNNHGS